jgi:large subunit ribosomal protein L21
MMYAVVQTGGKQYRVKEGQTIKVEKLPVNVADHVEFDKVLMVSHGDNVTVGAPYLAGATVKGKVLEQGRHDKVKIIKFNRRKHHRKETGHRQYFTAIKIEKISG